MSARVGSTTITAVVVDASGGRTLRVAGPAGPVLPVASVPERLWFPDVEPVLAALAAQHGIHAVALECLARTEPDEDADGADLADGADGALELEVLLELVPGAEPPAGAVWVAEVPSRAAAAVARPLDRPATPAWSRPGWSGPAFAWIEDRLAAADRPLTGPPTQVRTWGLSTVFRCPTAGGTVYFKAAGHSSTIRPTGPDAEPLLFAHEARLLELLARERPGAGPAPIAVDVERVWMLLPDLGPPLGDSTDVEQWSAALRAHAVLQRSWVGATDRLLAVGCVDRRLAVLDAEVDHLLGPNPITTQLAPDVRDRVARLGPRVHAQIAALAAHDVPETLVHSDLHPRNVGVRDGRATTFDWTDAAIAHPFLDLVTFFEDRSPVSGDPHLAERLRADYLAEWVGVGSPAGLRAASDLAAQVAPVHQAVSYLHLVDSVSGTSRQGLVNGGTHWLTRLLGD